ncbi:SMYD [Mytilus coruscus]|uniref:SMYD n=1 Tax=Mytilus coruscus TaxID=42192 RepID=A0A6J8ET49_MYTCO|nr:SMYD [Mytilus coruscus]
MYRYFGVSLEENKKVSEAFSWHHRVVVDSKVYFFLLKYLIKRKLGKVEESNEAVYNIHYLLFGPNVRHLDVACNLIAWLFCSNNNTPLTPFYSSISWKVMNSWDLCYTIFEEEMKSKPCQFNSGKFHALVSLYNTWFARKSPSVQFCSRCLAFSPEKLQQCSRRKVAKYCSRQCQKIEWKFHKVVCQRVRKVMM